MIGFVLKCVFWLGLVLVVITGRGGGESIVEEPRERPRVAAQRAAEAHVRPKKSENAAPRAAEDHLSGLAQRAKGALVEAAREKCLGDPIQCLLLAEKFGRASTGNAPERR